MKSLLLKIASLFYGWGVAIRNWCFDREWFAVKEFHIPVICVGNITVGGTGKTPIVELLVEYLSENHNVAVISRGYGRTTKGYRVVETTDSYRDVGDEPLQIKLKFPSVPVVVCERRVEGIEQMLAEFEGIEVVIMDDGFQHRYVKPYLNIVVVDATRPPYEDNLLPYGQLRDQMSSLYRANMYVVTKCPEKMNPINYRIFNQHLMMKASQSIFFSRMAERSLRSLLDNTEADLPKESRVIAMSGIGNSDVFKKSVERRYTMVATLDFEDHHVYRIADLERIEEMLSEYKDAVIVMTEKDAVKLINSDKIPASIKSRMYYETIGVDFVYGSGPRFYRTLDEEVKRFVKYREGDALR